MLEQVRYTAWRKNGRARVHERVDRCVREHVIEPAPRKRALVLILSSRQEGPRDITRAPGVYRPSMT
jgi:hypothetical protein